jgi:signal peptidase I
MEPQLQINDRIVVSKVAYRLHPPRRGDIVVFDAPVPVALPKEADPLVNRVLRGIGQAVGVTPPSTQEYVKRVLALPGEVVEGRGGHVWVNGREVVEPYLPATARTGDFPPRTVPRGTLWVMGDNRVNSADSRVFGPIKRSTVVGRVVFRAWPFSTAAFL